MNTSIKTLVITACLLLSVNFLKAQVTPTTDSVYIFCDGGTLDLGSPATGSSWIIRYSEEQTDTPTDLTLEGNTITGEDLKTGYYYVATKAEGACESEMTEIAVYKFKPLSVSLTAPSNYCIEDASAQTFSASVTTSDTYTSYAYQWYEVNGETESAIEDATSSTYQPDAAIAAGTSTTYRVKVGYFVGTAKYCGETADKVVTVTTKPAKPTITVEGESTGETW